MGGVDYLALILSLGVHVGMFLGGYGFGRYVELRRVERLYGGRGSQLGSEQ